MVLQVFVLLVGLQPVSGDGSLIEGIPLEKTKIKN